VSWISLEICFLWIRRLHVSKNGLSWLTCMFPKFPFSNIFKIGKFVCCIHRFLLFVRYTYASGFHFVRWWNLLSLFSEGDTQNVPNHQTTSRQILADCKLVIHHIFASVNNSLLFRYQTRVFISVHAFKLLIMNKIDPLFWGKIIEEKVRKWCAMENISTSEEVMVSGE
jgi:hypothetical protein